jgi:ubiquinol-cytochrome c reductase cytochrome b subunit
MQVVTGLLLTSYYVCSFTDAWSSILNIIIEVNYGHIIRTSHVIGAMLYMLLLLSHWLRGIYICIIKASCSHLLTSVSWYIGWLIFILSILEVFFGYILNWGNMSYWGILVIIQIIASLPIIGAPLSELVWCHSSYVLNRLLMLHFFIGLIIVMLIVCHILMLHNTSSSNFITYSSSSITLPFYIYLYKDLQVLMLLLLIISICSSYNTIIYGEHDNNNAIDVAATPLHILPVFAILFIYLFVKVINNKLIALCSIACLFYMLISVAS